MRIISKFKDYYDSAMGHGMDLSVIFKRDENVVFSNYSMEPIGKDSDLQPYKEFRPALGVAEIYYKYLTINFAGIIILFCGEMYRCVRVKVHRADIIRSIPGKDILPPDEYHHFYDIHSLTKFLTKLGIPDEVYSDYSLLAWHHRNKNSRLDLLKEFFDRPKVAKSYMDAIHLKRIIYASYLEDDRLHKVVTEPNLSEYEFVKVMPPTIAYQEIEMFLSGVLGQANAEPINISDKDRIYQHGFDKKSFRKEPTKNRR